MRRSVCAVFGGLMVLAAFSAEAAPPPPDAGPVTIDFESCAVGSRCREQPLEYVYASYSGTVVDFSGNHVLRLDDGRADYFNQRSLGVGSTDSHVPFEEFSPHLGYTHIRLFNFYADDGRVDLLMPDGGYVLVAGVHKTILAPGVWTNIDAGWSGAGVLVRTRGDAFIDNFTLSRDVDYIPEPAVWGLMILGFGAVGARLRRRKAGDTVEA